MFFSSATICTCCDHWRS